MIVWTFLTGLAGRMGARGAWNPVLAVVLAVAAAIALYGAVRGGWALFDALNDREAVRQDRQESNAELLNRQIGVERATGADKAARDKAAADELRKLEEKADEARRNRRSPWDAAGNEL